MEIVSKIWNALTVENEQLISISFIPMIFIELTISMLLFTTILQIKRTKKQSILYVVSLSFIGIITHLFVPEPYNTFINLIACPILIVFIFKAKILNAVLAQIIQFASFIIIGSVLVNIYLPLLKIPINYIKCVPIYKICYSLILYLSVYLIYKLFEKMKINISVLNNMNTRNKSILLINLIIGIIIIAIQARIVDMYMDILPYFLALSSIITLSLYFFISIYSLLRTTKLEKTAMDLEEQKLYNKTLTILYDNVRGFKHDFNNIVQSIGGYIDSDNIKGLKSYYKDLLKDCQSVNSLNLLNPEIINNPAIYSLLTSKYHKAQELGIKINIEAFLDLNTLDVNIYEFTKILGILLDNAIEACNNSSEKTINIFIRRDTKVKRSLFIIENTYSNKDVDTDKIFEKGYTSKNNKDSKNHGLGLWEVRKIIKKSRNLNLFTTKNNMLFKQQLEIYDKKL